MASYGKTREMAVSEPRAEKKPAKVLEEIRLKRGIDGGITATHHYSSFAHEPKAHELADRAALHAHLDEHMGLGGKSNSETDKEDE
jgi:hypothetical protein